ncbi:MAG: Gfo/Idh/MocA family oxidoreductase [Saprospiraceae bacterium]|nr:Gfo/Idh/MocA family oxidoreductase [Lewinella sp.]
MNDKTFHINRRHFLMSASAAMAYSSLGAYGLDLLFRDTPLRVGLIGAGWFGKNDLFRLSQVADIEVVSICDVDQHMLDDAVAQAQQWHKSGKTPRKYNDYRKMLAEKDLDIVIIGTPDHWHALQMIEAVRSGAHVYVEKPISVDVIEGEAMVAAARKYNKIVQVGTQRVSTPHLIDAKKSIVEAGLLGKISHVEMCCYIHQRVDGNPPLEPVPDWFDYEMWCGPAPKRPYDGLPHIRWWRAFNEYGNGILGDMCIHMYDAVRWTLDLGWPDRVRSVAGIYVQKDGKSNISDTQHAIFEYPELNCVWQHRTWGTSADPDYPWAYIIYGEKGTLKASTRQYEFIPQGDGGRILKEAITEGEQFPADIGDNGRATSSAPPSRWHMLDFLAAIDKNERPVSDIEQGHISTASCILANISAELNGRPLQYDPKTRTVVGDEEATRMLAREYRKPWVHPTPENV